MDLSIKVVSDVICPWCWIGKRRLDRALSSLRPGVKAKVIWEPFELNPDMPMAGMDRRQYRSAKFGSWERSQGVDAQVAAAGRTEGLDYHFERITRTPNTRDAHRLILLAERQGCQAAIVEALFAAYFRDGLDIGQRDVLADLATQVGFDCETVADFLSGDEGNAEVQRLEMEHVRRGISGVPTFLLDGSPVASGAQKSEILAKAIRSAAGVEVCDIRTGTCSTVR